MHALRAIAPPAERRAFTIDLIGDLDTELGRVLGETLASIAVDGGGAVVISTRHVARTTSDGIARFDAAIVRARAEGCAIAIDAGNRRMRTAFAFARIACERDVARYASRRHVMIAHHAQTV